MIADLKTYPMRTDSGVPWLGEVPKHWEVLKLRHVLRRHTERERPDLPLLSVVREQGVILRDTTSTDENHNYIPDDLSNYKVVRAGQFAMNKMKAWQGSYGVSYHDGIVSPAYFVFDVLGLEVDFFHAAIRSRAYVPAFTRASDGVRIGQWDLAEARMREIQFLVPPAAEQDAIVRFLDHADRRIRRYIRAKQKLITLLEEQKQALIHQVITGQIDVRTGRPYSAYKPSGVEWLGEVPRHWEVRRARYIFREIDERSQEGAEQHLSMSQRLGLVPSHLVENRTLVSESYAGGKLCRTGDLVLNRLKAHLGVFARAQQSGVISADYTVLRPNRGAEAEYFEELLRSPSCRGELRIRAKGIVEGFWRLYTDDLYDIYLPLPPEEEQRSIIRWIESVGARIERSSVSGNREIVLLYEYRTRLIADVVTGKLDVREASAALPEVDPLADEEALHDPDPGTDDSELALSAEEVEA